MSDEIRVNRPASASGGQPVRNPDMSGQSDTTEAPSSSSMPWLILGIVVVVIIVLGFLFRAQLFKGSSSMSPAGGGTVSGYQAVFLTNGQVYFGKLSDTDSNYLTLTDIYYLQVIQKQPLQGTPASTTAAQAPGQDISLVKLGQELHGPVDLMHISRSQVLFYEDLKTEGSVVKAIQSYKATPAK